MCGIIECVAKPELVITSNPDDHFLKANCSLCPNIRFNLLGNTLAEKTLLRAMFDVHARQVHKYEDTSQAKESAK
jgi:hypothetical protein